MGGESLVKQRLNSDISEVVNQLSQCKESMDYALRSVKDIRAFIDSEVWRGKTKTVTVALLELCIKFHSELNKCISDSYVIMKDLEDNANDYMESSYYAKKWRG